tara:strand:- start:136 stop:303 length:168 start_codon:yes stop_codon:yes gene_type:complete
MTRFTKFTDEERKKIAEAIWRRQRCYIAGDKQFNEYGKLLDEVLDQINYVPGSIV